LPYTFEQVAIFEDGFTAYFEGLLRIPLDDVPYGHYIITRKQNGNLFKNYDNSLYAEEIIEARYIR
jgi:hypothetical protein